MTPQMPPKTPQKPNNLNLPFPSDDESPKSTETLRLLANLPPPAGIEDRIHHRIEARIRLAEFDPQPRSFWSFWMPARRLQFAGAAALVLALAGSTWTLYHSANSAAALQPTPAVPSAAPGRSFGTAGAEGHPSTLSPIKVPPPPNKKPSATHNAHKPSPKTLANPSRAAKEKTQ